MTEPVDLVLHGGLVALGPAAAHVDIAVRDGTIACVGLPRDMPASRQTVDITGKHVIPGAIDPHLHFNTFSLHIDTLASATWSAAHGGITTVLGFLRGPSGTSVQELVEKFHQEGAAGSPVDFAFHLILDPQGDHRRQIEDGLRLGVTSFKMFMAYPRRGLMSHDWQLYRAMRAITETRGIAMVHAENGHIIDGLEDEFAASGRRSPVDFPATRPALAEVEAIHRALMLADAAGCPLYVVHVSTAGGMWAIREAKNRGQKVVGETCPQYLLLDETAMEPFGPLAKIAPPLRTPADQQALWDGLQQGSLSTYGSDHAPYRRAAKEASPDIFEVPFGAPGTETLLPVLYSQGVVRRGLPLSWLAAVVSENPARTFGVYPRKGSITPGADADLVVLDPDVEWTVRAANLHSRSDYTLFEGMRLKGRPVSSWVRGTPVLSAGSVVAKPGHGQFLRRIQAMVESNG